MTIDTSITHWRTLRRYATFENDCNKIHNFKYDYSKAVYRGSQKHITVICPIHGDFDIEAKGHVYGRGCQLCSLKTHSKNSALTNNQFIEKSTAKFGTIFKYLSQYENMHVPVKLECAHHGIFEYTPAEHLKSNTGCPFCSKALKNRLTTATFISKATKVHAGKYSYNMSTYVDSCTPVQITCNVHGDFWQIAKIHLEGKGCSSCGIRGFDKNKQGTLYYIKFKVKDTAYYKIGITNNSIRKRYTQAELSDAEVLYEEIFPVGYDAYYLEQLVLNSFKNYRYTGCKILKNGNTELFVKDVFDYKGRLNGNTTNTRDTT